MLRKFLNIKWATLAEVTGIPVDALRTASARTQLNEASAARLTALADLTVTHPKANEFRAALAELPEPTPVTQPVPAYVPIVPKHGPNSPAATLEEMAQRYGVEVRAATQWMRVHGGTGGPRRPRAGHLLRLDALGDGAAAEIDSATVHLPLEMLDALGDDAVEIGGAIVFTREALLARGWKRAYIAQEGHANVPRRYVTDDGVTLGNWVATRRRDCRAGKLTAARIAELNALGMVWDPRVA